MNKDELYQEGFILVRKWYASHLRRLGGRRHRPLVADRLWDLMVDALLRAVDRFDGRVAGLDGRAVFAPDDGR